MDKKLKTFRKPTSYFHYLPEEILKKIWRHVYDILVVEVNENISYGFVVHEMKPEESHPRRSYICFSKYMTTYSLSLGFDYPLTLSMHRYLVYPRVTGNLIMTPWEEIMWGKWQIVRSARHLGLRPFDDSYYNSKFLSIIKRFDSMKKADQLQILKENGVSMKGLSNKSKKYLTEIYMKL
tara:strand:- start:108 stop:647 length:540 start_codon:yes stop_codon:yes gene_type:complete